MRVIESISHVTVATPDIETSVADYTHLLGTEPVASDGAFAFGTGNIALVLRAVPGEPAGMSGFAFRTKDIEKARQGFARCGLASAGDGVFDARATHGLPVAMTDRALPRSKTSAWSLDHVVIRTPNPERAVALYGGRFGLDMRLDRSNPDWNARLMFFRCGDLVVEIAHVLSDGVSDGPDTFGGLSWRVPDIDAEHARLSAQGFELSPVRTGRRSGSKVCTVRNRTSGVPT